MTKSKLNLFKESTLLSPEGRPLLVYINTIEEVPVPPTPDLSVLFDPETFDIYFSKDEDWITQEG